MKTEKVEKVDRVGFSPYVEGLDEALQGGIPVSSWVVLYGNAGSYKTLHSLAFTLAGLRQGEKAVYVSTEEDYRQLRDQAEALGWKIKANDAHLTLKTMDSEDYGDYDLVWIDRDTLRILAWKLNALEREEREGGRRRKWYWYGDPELVTYAVILGLEAVGAVSRREDKITLEQVRRMRIKDGYYSYKNSLLDVDRNVRARIVIDSISMLFTSRWSLAGRILTDMRVRLECPLYTFILTSHVGKSSEEEIGAQIAHIVDGRIRLWNELRGREARVTGWISKMRLTDHSRRLHTVSIEGSEAKALVWREEQ